MFHIVKNEVEVLSVSSVDRLGRNAFDIQSTIDYLNQKKINLKIDQLINTPKSEIPMTLDAIFKQKKTFDALWTEINTFNDENNPLDVYNSSINQFLLGAYPTDKTINQYQMDNLKTNPYLNEAVNIINEFNGGAK